MLVDCVLVECEWLDLVIVVIGVEFYWLFFECGGELQVVDVWQVLCGEVWVGCLVLVIDWWGDWIGFGIVEKFVCEGYQVCLVVNGIYCGESLLLYVCDQLVGELYCLGILVMFYVCLYGCDDIMVYMQYSVSGEVMLFEEVDILVLCQGYQLVDCLVDSLYGLVEVLWIGDCLVFCIVEEVIYEGFKVVWSI